VSDLSALVGILFLPPGDDPRYMEAADVNGTGSMNISDLSFFVSYLFRAGPPPVCN
jgi:hypothetical protein